MPGADANTRQAPDRLGLLVVHGIGDPPAGAALTDFTDALAGHGLAEFEPNLETQRLVDPSRSTTRQTRFFPVTSRRGRSTADPTTSIIAAEVFWGSASQLSPGRLGVLQGIVSLMINVPALLVGANGGHKANPGLVPWLTRAVALILSGPAFALNAAVLATFVFHIAVAYFAGASDSNAVVPWLAAAAVAALSLLPWIKFPETRWSFRLVGPGLLLTLLGHATTRTFVTRAVHWLEAAVAVVALAQLAAIVWLLLRSLVRGWDRRYETAVLATSLQLGIWTTLVPSVWSELVKRMPSAASAEWITALFAKAAASDGRQWPLAGVVGATLLVVLGARRVHQWRELRRPGISPETARPCARVILHPAVAVSLIAVTVVGCTLILAATAVELSQSLIPLDQLLSSHPNIAFAWLERVIPQVRISTPLFVLFAVLTPQLRVGLDLVDDVISYLHYRCEVGQGVLTKYGRAHITVYDPVRIRFDLVMHHLVRDLEVRRVVILAHSQGSTIVLDELAREWTAKELPAEISLVTFGSPISHIYQHYFPGLYPGWEDVRWQLFLGRLRRWLNVYRLADYVGTTVPPPPITEFAQRTVGAGGHTNYWTDPRFIRALEDWNLLGRTANSA